MVRTKEAQGSTHLIWILYCGLSCSESASYTRALPPGLMSPLHPHIHERKTRVSRTICFPYVVTLYILPRNGDVPAQVCAIPDGHIREQLQECAVG